MTVLNTINPVVIIHVSMSISHMLFQQGRHRAMLDPLHQAKQPTVHTGTLFWLTQPKNIPGDWGGSNDPGTTNAVRIVDSTHAVDEENPRSDAHLQHRFVNILVEGEVRGCGTPSDSPF